MGVPTEPGFYWCVVGSALEVVEVDVSNGELVFYRAAVGDSYGFSQAKQWGKKLTSDIINPPGPGYYWLGNEPVSVWWHGSWRYSRVGYNLSFELTPDVVLGERIVK